MSTLSALGLVTEFCSLRGLPVPSALVGSSEKSVAQYKAVLNAVVRELLTCEWQEQKVRTSFTSVATASQGELTTLFPGFTEFVPNAFWAATQTVPVQGPITDSHWAALQALDISGPPYSYWVSQGLLYLSPVPPAGETFTAIYRTSYGYSSSAGVAQAALLDDTDLLLFPDDVLLKGFEAEWKRIKGLPHSEDWAKFQDYLAKAKAPLAPNLSLECSPRPSGPRIFIPPGSWSL